MSRDRGDQPAYPPFIPMSKGLTRNIPIIPFFETRFFDPRASALIRGNIPGSNYPITKLLDYSIYVAPPPSSQGLKDLTQNIPRNAFRMVSPQSRRPYRINQRLGAFICGNRHFLISMDAVN